jgi:hypothetical protein
MSFRATPTMWAAMQDPSFVRLLAGAVGSGKSVCQCHTLVQMAMQQAPNAEGVRKTRTAIVRNTADQLKSTTQKTFFDWFPPGVWGTFKVQDQTFVMDHDLADGTRMHAEFMFRPLDTPDDVARALSLELTFLWGNEWRELHPKVVDGLLMRLRRYPSAKDGGHTRSCALFDTNMPDVDTWHHTQMEEPPSNWSIHVQPPAILSLQEYLAQEGAEPDADLATPDARGSLWWVNPRADNLANLDPEYYPGIIPGKSLDFIDVYLRCRYGRSLSGLPVYDKTFNPEFHVAKTRFSPLRSADHPVILGLDFGRTPAMTPMQRNAFGQLVILDEVDGENMGIDTFLRTKAIPLLSSPEYAGCTFLFAPDPAGWFKQQIGEVSPVDIVKAAGFKVAHVETNDPERRIEAVERELDRHIGGKPALIVNPECKERIKGFRYGYRFKLNKGGVQDNRPDKNKFSHGADSIQYGVMVATGGQAGAGARLPSRRDVKQVSAGGWT